MTIIVTTKKCWGKQKMNLYAKDGTLLYSSPAGSLIQTIENAVQDNIVLDNINLKNADLRNINLDNVIMRNAYLKGADLTGANISEACLDNTDFSYANLYNACFAYSSIIHGNFLESEFGATDFSQAIIDQSQFSSPSTFSIAFRHTKSMDNTHYIHNNQSYPMHKPPTFIRGEHNDIIILDRHIMVDSEIFSQTTFEASQHDHSNLNQNILISRQIIKTMGKR